MTLRQQQFAVFFGTVIVIFGIFAAGLWFIAQRLTAEATLQTALLLAHQVEIALADSLKQHPASPAPAKPAPRSNSFWNFLGKFFPGKPQGKARAPSRGTEIKGLMQAFIDRSGSIEAMWVINPEGKVLYSSREGADSQEVSDSALRENLRRGVTTISSHREGKVSYYEVLVPLQMPKGVGGTGGLRLWINPADWTELLSGIWRQLTLLFVLGAGMALLSASLITTLYTRRFRLISDALRQAEAGTYQARPRYSSQDEVGTSLDLIDRLVKKQKGAVGRTTPLQRVAVATRTLAHELKNPLNAMAVHLELLSQSSKEQREDSHPNGQQQRSLTALEAGIRQVDQLVRDFADYAAPVVLEPQPIDLAPVLSASLEAIRAQCTVQRIELSTQFPPGPWPAQGDATRLRQAFDNLLRNAVEAQPDGGAIRVTGFYEGAGLTLLLSDDGPGIAPERREMLFEFGRSTKRGGSGIGLPLSQLIVEAHGGTLQYDERDGASRGATFRLTLPLMKEVS